MEARVIASRSQAEAFVRKYLADMHAVAKPARFMHSLPRLDKTTHARLWHARDELAAL